MAKQTSRMTPPMENCNRGTALEQSADKLDGMGRWLKTVLLARSIVLNSDVAPNFNLSAYGSSNSSVKHYSDHTIIKRNRDAMAIRGSEHKKTTDRSTIGPKTDIDSQGVSF